MFEEQIERIIALHEGAYWIALEQEALPLLLEMQAKLNDLQNRVDAALATLNTEAASAAYWVEYSGNEDKRRIGAVVCNAIKILTGEGEA